MIFGDHIINVCVVSEPPLPACPLDTRTPVLQKVIFGDHMINAWYQSPLPPPFDTVKNLYFCPYSLKYFRKRRHLQSHLDALPAAARRPPGDRIYQSPLPGRQYKLSTSERPTLTAACDPRVRVHSFLFLSCFSLSRSLPPEYSVWCMRSTAIRACIFLPKTEQCVGKHITVYEVDGKSRSVLFCPNPTEWISADHGVRGPRRGAPPLLRVFCQNL